MNAYEAADDAIYGVIRGLCGRADTLKDAFQFALVAGFDLVPEPLSRDEPYQLV